MKPVLIIAIAVVCSVVAVLGVLMGLQQIATMQAQQAYDEYEQQVKSQQMEIVNAYNLEISRCNTIFVDNIMGKYQCSDNAVENFQIYLLDEYYYGKLKYTPSNFDSKDTFALPKTQAEAEYMLKQIKKQLEESEKSMNP
jgi:hypothetical protein